MPKITFFFLVVWSSNPNEVYKVKVKVKSLSPVWLFGTRLLHPWDFPGKSTAVGCHFLLQRIFPTQGSNLGLLHCKQMIYHLSPQGSPKWGLYIIFNLVLLILPRVTLFPLSPMPLTNLGWPTSWTSLVTSFWVLFNVPNSLYFQLVEISSRDLNKFT